MRPTAIYETHRSLGTTSPIHSLPSRSIADPAALSDWLLRLSTTSGTILAFSLGLACFRPGETLPKPSRPRSPSIMSTDRGHDSPQRSKRRSKDFDRSIRVNRVTEKRLSHEPRWQTGLRRV